MSHNYTTKVENFIVPYLGKNGYTLIKSEFVEEEHNWYLRLYIDLSEEEFAARTAKMEETKAELDEEQLEDVPDEVGVSINDCVKVSRYLSKWLDKEDFIKEVYTLEVCSKGFLNNENE